MGESTFIHTYPQGRHEPGIMSSGLEVHSDCIDAFGLMKQKKTQNRAILFKISDTKTSIIVDKIILKDGTDQQTQYEQIIGELPEDEGRYIVWDLLIAGKSGTENDKLVFMSWCPDKSNIKAKMIFASSKDALKKKLMMPNSIDCADKDDCDYKEVIKSAATK